MNYRFKFRYAHREKVYEVLDIDFYTGYIKVIRPNKSEKRCTFQYDPDCLLQCTGLKDKNGVLIYEDDIVKGAFEDETLTVVRWIDALACFELCSGKQGISLGDFDADELEVIGNVYENPKLLNSEEQANDW